MSTTEETIGTVLVEIRAVAAELVELRADVKLATAHVGDVEQIKADVARIELHLKRIDTLMSGPPALEERLLALETKQEVDDSRARRDDAATRKAAGRPEDQHHADVIERHVRASEDRTEVKLVPMRERITELGDAVKTFGKVLRENQSAVLVLTGVAALILAGLLLVLISAFGSPVPIP